LGGSLPWLLISSWMWHLTRWDGLFLGTYLVTHLGAQPIANQFVGVAMFAPMLLGSYVSSRVDVEPRKLVLVTELVLLPVSVLMAVLVGGDAAQTWMVYAFELACGFGGMVNMTAQRELLFRIGGPSPASGRSPQRSTRVLNTELTGMASAMMLGPLVGGLTIAAFGLGVAFAVPAITMKMKISGFPNRTATATRMTRPTPAQAIPTMRSVTPRPPRFLRRPRWWRRYRRHRAA